MRLVLGLDPGTESSAYVTWDGRTVLDHGYLPNLDLLAHIRALGTDTLVVIEQIEAMGFKVGRTTFETVFWSGRFAEAARIFDRIPRRSVKLALLGKVAGNDAQVRRAIYLRFGGEAKAKGTKAKPGVLAGITSHKLAALGVALAYMDASALPTLESAPARSTRRFTRKHVDAIVRAHVSA